jgi:hypothetical protein
MGKFLAGLACGIVLSFGGSYAAAMIVLRKSDPID